MASLTLPPPQIANDPDQGLGSHIKELVFQASGQERIDPAWIASLWKPECKPEATENRVRGIGAELDWHHDTHGVVL